MIYAPALGKNFRRYGSALQFIVSMLVITCAYSNAIAQNNTLYLEDVQPLLSQSANHQPTDIVVNGQHYSHALVSSDWNSDWSAVTAPDGNYQTWRWVSSYNIDQKFRRFTVTVGVADGSPSDRAFHFEVNANGKDLGITPVMHVGDAPETFDVDVSNVIRLDLIVTSDVHDGNGGKDDAVWADPTLYSDNAVSPGDLSHPQIGDSSPSNSSPDVFDWKEIPENADVPILHVTMDSQGYHLFDTQNEVVIVPFGAWGSGPNIWVMKFGRSPDNQMHFVSYQSDPILYLPDSEWIDIANVPNARWYPMTSSFHSSTPNSLGIAETLPDFNTIDWYPGMACYGAFEARFGHSSLSIQSMGSYYFTIDGQRFGTMQELDAYEHPHFNPHHWDLWDEDQYQWANNPPPTRHHFDEQNHFGKWPDRSAHDNGQNGGVAIPVVPAPVLVPPVQMNSPNPIARPVQDNSNGNGHFGSGNSNQPNGTPGGLGHGDNSNGLSHTGSSDNTSTNLTTGSDHPKITDSSTHTLAIAHPVHRTRGTEPIVSRDHIHKYEPPKPTPTPAPTPSPSPTPTPSK